MQSAATPENIKAPAATRRVTRETRWFALIVALHLPPVWLFTYFPTQDGPSHLANAVVLKDYGKPGTRYHEFYELRWQLFPNWTSHLLLAGLMTIAPPLIAEKLLVSIYIIGFAWSFRYFLGAFGREMLASAPVSLLFAYNFCLLMGFYGYLLSLIFYWLILGYVVRSRERLSASGAVPLTVLFLTAYFSHLVGFGLAAMSAVWVALARVRRQHAQLLWVILALAPAALLTAHYLQQTDKLVPSNQRGLKDSLWVWFGNLQLLSHVKTEIRAINQGLFRAYEGPFPLSSLVLAFYGLLGVAYFASRKEREHDPLKAEKTAVALLAAAIFLLYLLLPQSLGAHGGYLTARLPLLPPLLILAWLGFPQRRVFQRTITMVLLTALAANVVLVTRFVAHAQADLADFTQGSAFVGRNRTLTMSSALPDAGHIDYLGHADDYYCLSTGNINLENYEAATPYFPVRFLPVRQRPAEFILYWNASNDIDKDGLRDVFHADRLRIVRVVDKADESTPDQAKP